MSLNQLITTSNYLLFILLTLFPLVHNDVVATLINSLSVARFGLVARNHLGVLTTSTASRFDVLSSVLAEILCLR